MEYDILDVLTLDDNNDYVIVDKCEYLGNNYAFLVDIHDKKNIIYVQIKGGNVISALGSSEIAIIYELSKIFAHNSSMVLGKINESGSI